MYYPRGRSWLDKADHGLGLLTPALEKRLRHLIRYHKRRQKRLELDGGEPLKVINARILLRVHSELKRYDIPRSHLLHEKTINHQGLVSVLRDLDWCDLTYPKPISDREVVHILCRLIHRFIQVRGAHEVRLGSSHPSSIYCSGGGDTPGNYVA